MRRALAPALLVALALAAPARALRAQEAPAGTRVDFVNARLADVVQALAAQLGLNVVLGDVPDRRVTFQTAAPVRHEELGTLLETLLESHGLVMVTRGTLVQVLPAERAPATALRTFVVPLKYASAEELAEVLGQTFGATVGGSRGGSLADRSLSRNLDTFRERERATFDQRRDDTRDLARAIGAEIGARGDTARGALVGQTTIVPSLPGNALVIRTAPANYPILRETIEALDRRPPQVLLEVTVAEVTLGQGTEFGIDWSAVGGGAVRSARFGTPSDTTAGGLALRLVHLDGVNVRAVLRALASRTKVRVLSTPEILATNNREAEIVVGSRVPFVASARLGDFTLDRSVQYERVGTRLAIVPTVNDDGYVSVEILQEVSTLTTQTVRAAFDAPVISTREASTRAVMRDGQTVVIGGLIGDSRDDTDAGVPILKDIPLLGWLFKRQSATTNRTELAIFVTPYVVRTDADADEARERHRRQLDESAPGLLPPKTPMQREPQPPLPSQREPAQPAPAEPRRP